MQKNILIKCFEKQTFPYLSFLYFISVCEVRLRLLLRVEKGKQEEHLLIAHKLMGNGCKFCCW